MDLIKTVWAADGGAVNCFGNDCGLCSLLETVGRAYNFFIAVSFAVAVLVAIVAGISYLINGARKPLFQKSSLLLKSAVGGFALILSGWLIIHTVVWVAGFSNQGDWWRFQCFSDSEKMAVGQPNFAAYYQNLKKFSSLTDFLASKEEEGRIAGPKEAQVLLTQLGALQEGEALQFLAPAQIQSMDGIENLFLPLLTVMKEGNNLKLESAGEYLDLLRNAWPKSNSQNNQYAAILNKMLGTDSYTDNRYLLDADGSVLKESASGELSSLFGKLGNVLANSSLTGDRTGQTAAAGNENPELSELLAGLLNNEADSNQGDKIISVILSETMKLADEVLVSRGGASVLGKTAATSGWGYEKWRCLGNGGEWVDGECQCPSGNSEEINAYCQATKNLSQNCKRSGGTWRKIGEGINNTPVCGFKKQSWDSPKYAADGESAGMESYYCQCKNGFCVDEEGACRADLDDDDGDKIANSQDVCPTTPAFEKNKVNRSVGGKHYGCGCGEIGLVSRECPPDQCVGDNWVAYPTGTQECQDGKLLAYSCKPIERGFDESCVNQDKLAGKENWNANNSSNQTFANRKNSNANTSPFKSASKNANSSRELDNSKKAKTAEGKDLPKDDFSKEPKGGDRIPSGSGESGHGTPQGNSTPEAIKAALKRIHDRDPLRYEMLFRHLHTINRTSFQGGYCYGCGTIYVNAGMSLGIMDQIILHEGTHAGQACVHGWGLTASVERIACANQMGSLDRVEGHEDTREFPRQSMEVGYMGKEVRGYISRRQTVVSPKGDLGTAAYHWPIAYAFSYGDRTEGPYHYGEHNSKLILGLKASEESILKKVMDQKADEDGKVNCRSVPPEGLPSLPQCKGNPPVMRIN